MALWALRGNLNNSVTNAGLSALNGNNAVSTTNWNYASRKSVNLIIAAVHCTAGAENSVRRGSVPTRKGELLVETAGPVGNESPVTNTERGQSVIASCRNIDITDWHTILPWVRACLKRHKKRYDFRHLLMKVGGMTGGEYERLMAGERGLLEPAAENVAKEAARQIRERKLNLSPVQLREKEDHSTFKVRLIGRESAMQQIMDYVAVKACEDIWQRRLVPQQSSSIKGRGPAYGVAMISRWLRRDRRASEWAVEHGRRYTRKCRYFVKVDLSRCYQSMRIGPFMERFSRDCGNDDLIWLWEQILNSHHVEKPDGSMYEGFMIGALPSQQACQYVLSYAYRYATGLHVMRHGKPKQLVTHMTLFMDDMLLFSSSRRDLKEAVEKLVKYLGDEFGLSVKENWQICDVDESVIDMMGYSIHGDGGVTVRPRVFLRARRLAYRAMRHGVSLRQARRACAYKGYFWQKSGRIPLKSKRVFRKLHLNGLFRASARIISRQERRTNENRIECQTGQNTVYAPA